MSIKISIQNKPGLPPWALTNLLLIVRQFHCHASFRNGEITVDGKKLLQVVSLIKAELPKLEVNLSGDDEAEALDYIRHSQVGRFITED